MNYTKASASIECSWCHQYLITLFRWWSWWIMMLSSLRQNLMVTACNYTRKAASISISPEGELSIESFMLQARLTRTLHKSAHTRTHTAHTQAKSLAATGRSRWPSETLECLPRKHPCIHPRKHVLTHTLTYTKLSFACVNCSSKDYTSSFGLTDQEGSFTPNIHHAFNRLAHY